MHKLHIANTFFEWELETQPKMSLTEAFLQHVIFRQLQFLPVVYAEKSDGMAASDAPFANYWDIVRTKGISTPRFFTLEKKDFSPYKEIESWGASQLIAEWADRHSLTYQIPEWPIVKQVNSKHFSFENSPKLPHAILLMQESQAKQWLHSFEGLKVLKTCYGVSGKGHLIIEQNTSWEKILSFLTKEWNKGLPVIGEPWVKRILDFSTQWHIDSDKTVAYIGSTICDNDERGQYRFNLVGDEKALFNNHFPFLVEHQQTVGCVMQNIARLGFFGNVGVDAMLYTLPENSDVIHLHPVVEINARKTMGWAALQFQRRYHPNEIVRFNYSSGHEGFLPDCVESKQGKKVVFSRNLTCDRMVFTIKSHSS
jgi:hypothetical protein